MSRSETCFECEGTARLVREVREIPVGGRKVPVEVEIMRCQECGEGYFLPGGMRAAQEAAADLVRREEGLLTAGEIREFRQRAGLTQAELEQVLGSGPKTVTRWERGTIAQSRMADTLLRLLRAHPAALRTLAAERSVALPAEKSGTVSTRLGYRGAVALHGAMGSREANDLGTLLDELRVDSEAEGSPVHPFVTAISWSQRVEMGR
jgi:HTH-type transcriptional regulator / antitoxin MqsA